MIPPSYPALELFCYGVPVEQIARQLGRGRDPMMRAILRAARIVGRTGFWQFHVTNLDTAWVLRRQILDRMHQHGLLARKEAA